REGNNPKRRIAAPDLFNQAERLALVKRLKYVGSGHHKRFPEDYGLHSVSPRPAKSLCDGKRTIRKDEAISIFQAGIERGMFSYFSGNSSEPMPKYIWAVDADGDAYEAKIGSDGYHGYRLEDNDPMKQRVLQEWKRR
ncbi:MAG: hypothetical protein HQK55_08730, partial [Deltaproteobacteria bacterium]|nr:hypothetical protein [Deltaproteobacteria bacterium]